MEKFRTILLSFALGYGGTSIFLDTDFDILKGKFTAVMVMVFISVIITIYADYKKDKEKFG